MESFKILLVSEGIAAFGGIATYIRLLARSLQVRGHTVLCLTTNYRGDGFPELSSSLPCHDLSGIMLTWRKPVIAARLINRIEPDVVIGNHCSLLQYSLPLLKKPTRTVVVLHSDDPRFYRTAARNRQHVFRWVAPCPALKSAFQSYIPPRERARVRTIPHAVDDLVFFDRAQLMTRSRQITFVGYIARNKGADLLPCVMARVLAQHPDATLRIIGYGPLRATVEAEFTARGMQRNVTFTGPVGAQELAILLRSSRVFLLPTRVEGFGLAIAEAMMCGAVPVVTFLPGVTDQIIEEGVSGFLCGLDDVETFADRVNQLLSEAKWREFSHSATHQAVDRFSVNRAVDSYESLFREPLDPELSRTKSIFTWAIRTLFAHAKERARGLRAAWIPVVE